MFSIGGKVLYPVSSTGKECGVPGVEIKINGNRVGILTDQNGQWKYTLQQEGTYTFRPEFKHLRLVNGLGQADSNIMDQIGNIPIKVDLTVRDTAEVVTDRDVVNITPADTIFFPNDTMNITPADTVITTVSDTTREVVIPEADFIYHSPMKGQL